MSVVCCVCCALVVLVGSELKVNVLAFADALEVGFMVVGNVVVTQIEGRQCPVGAHAICKDLCVISTHVILREVEFKESRVCL